MSMPSTPTSAIEKLCIWKPLTGSIEKAALPFRSNTSVPETVIETDASLHVVPGVHVWLFVAVVHAVLVLKLPEQTPPTASISEPSAFRLIDSEPLMSITLPMLMSTGLAVSEKLPPATVGHGAVVQLVNV